MFSKPNVSVTYIFICHIHVSLSIVLCGNKRVKEQLASIKTSDVTLPH